MSEQLRNILLSSPVFQTCPEENAKQLASVGRIEHFPAPSPFSHEGGHPGVIRFILRGRIDLLRVPKAGQTARIPITRGGWATWLGCLYDQPWNMNLSLPAMRRMQRSRSTR